MSQAEHAAPSSIIGMSGLARILTTGEDPAPFWEKLVARFQADPGDGENLFDMAMLLRLMGKVDESLAFQREALGVKACYTCRHGRGDGLSVLVLVTSADVMSNAPIDFLFEDTDVTLHFLHMDVASTTDLPEHDVVFVAVGYSEANAVVLQHLAPMLAVWPRPVMNGQPEQILGLTRDGTSATFADCPSVFAPANLLVDRPKLQALAAGGPVSDLGGDFAYPLIVRPLDSHGGKGLEQITSAKDFAAYLERQDEATFYLSPFVDYSGDDGLFRKYRITFIDGQPFAAHLAVSEHWLVHYISAGMLVSAAKRAEEEAWMAGFDTDFAVRHGAAMRAIAERIGVDYFSIDCAETRDGRILLFEADVASIVHALDPVEIFPYKRPAMDKLFAAFHRALERRARPAEAAPARDAA